MKTRTFKTKTNDGYMTKVEVTVIESTKDCYDHAVIVQTKRLIPINDLEGYIRINKIVPTYFILRKTEKYALILSRTQSFKHSTFKMILQIVEDML